MEDEKKEVFEGEVIDTEVDQVSEAGLDLTSLGVGAIAAGAIYGIYRGAKWLKDGKEKRREKANERDLAKIERLKKKLSERNGGLPEEDMNTPETEEETTETE